jgi:glycosyltransferase involved in cell wall biosynthesis
MFKQNYKNMTAPDQDILKMTTISICVCTRRRKEGLEKLLNSLNKLELPANSEISIIIVENDDSNYSENVIKEFRSQSMFKINYFLETRQGLVSARNRSVRESGDCDFICFTDDDQVIDKYWLVELFRCQREFDADGVAGVTKPLFSKAVPAWVENFHKSDYHPYGTIVGSAFTGSLLLRKSCLAEIDGPFDQRLNYSGGEDSYLTGKVSDNGGIIRFNPEAVAFEIIPEDRTKIRFVIRRTFRRSNTRLYINSFDGKNPQPVIVFLKLTFRFFYGLLLLLPYMAFNKKEKYKGLIKIVNAIGGYAYFLGKKSKFYK